MSLSQSPYILYSDGKGKIFEDTSLYVTGRSGWDALQVPDDEKPALLEGVYRARLKQQPPADWANLDEAARTEQLRAALLQSWGSSELMQRQLAQSRGARIKEYLVDQGGLEDARLYLLDVSLGQADADGRVATPLQLDSE